MQIEWTTKPVITIFISPVSKVDKRCEVQVVPDGVW